MVGASFLPFILFQLWFFHLKAMSWNYEFNKFNESTKQDNERKRSANVTSHQLNHNEMEINMLHNHTISVSNSIEFGR